MDGSFAGWIGLPGTNVWCARKDGQGEGREKILVPHRRPDQLFHCLDFGAPFSSNHHEGKGDTF